MKAPKPTRALFDAYAARLSGTLHLRSDDLDAEIVVAEGRVVHASGLGSLMGDLDLPDTVPFCGRLMDDIALAARHGARADEAMEAAAIQIGRHLVRLSSQKELEASFVEHQPPAGAWPVPLAVPQLLFAGLEAERSALQVRQLIEPLFDYRVSSVFPGAWTGQDLGSVEARVLRASKKLPSLRELVTVVSHGTSERYDRALVSVEFLLRVGVLVLSAPPKVADEEDVEDPATEDMELPEDVEAEVAKLVKRRKRFEHQSPLHTLGIDPVKVTGVITPEQVAEGFRKVGRKYHPDSFVGRPAALQSAAGETFAALRAAYAHMRDPRAVEVEVERLRTQARGESFVDPLAKTRASVFRQQAEKLIAHRDFKGALAKLDTAAKDDPEDGRIQMLRLYMQGVLRELDPVKAAELMVEIEMEKGRHVADAHYYRGQLLKLGARNKEAMDAFRNAVEINEEHAEAHREIRLYERRQGDAPTERRAPLKKPAAKGKKGGKGKGGKEEPKGLLNADVGEIVGRLFGKR